MTVSFNEQDFHYINFDYKITEQYMTLPVVQDLQQVYDNPGDMFLVRKICYTKKYCVASYNDSEGEDDQDTRYPVVDGWIEDGTKSDDNSSKFYISDKSKFAFKNLDEIVDLWLRGDDELDADDTASFTSRLQVLSNELMKINFDAELSFNSEQEVLEIRRIYPLRDFSDDY